MLRHGPKVPLYNGARMVHNGGMTDPAAITIPGPRLRAQREAHGVTILEMAAELRHHRNTITRWENEPEVDRRRQRLYLAALRKIAD